MNVLVGCCGFAGSQASYFRDFSLVEVQQTFYQPPRLATAQRWRAAAAADFVFTMKAWQLITHQATSPTYRRLKTPLSPSQRQQAGSFKPTELVWSAWDQTRQIAAALAARVVVFQCPSSFGPTREHKSNLRRFFRRAAEELSSGPDVRPALAWEPRGDWSDTEIKALCRELDLIHVVDPFLRMPVTSGPFYFRLHGIGGYRHRYTDAELDRLATLVQGLKKGGYCLFNNISMREDAARLARLLEQRD